MSKSIFLRERRPVLRHFLRNNLFRFRIIHAECFHFHRNHNLRVSRNIDFHRLIRVRIRFHFFNSMQLFRALNYLCKNRTFSLQCLHSLKREKEFRPGDFRVREISETYVSKLRNLDFPFTFFFNSIWKKVLAFLSEKCIVACINPGSGNNSLNGKVVVIPFLCDTDKAANFVVRIVRSQFKNNLSSILA